jgi:hypothetical protein
MTVGEDAVAAYLRALRKYFWGDKKLTFRIDMAGHRMRTESLSCDSRGLVLFTYTEKYKPGTHGESYSKGALWYLS